MDVQAYMKIDYPNGIGGYALKKVPRIIIYQFRDSHGIQSGENLRKYLRKAELFMDKQ